MRSHRRRSRSCGRGSCDLDDRLGFVRSTFDDLGGLGEALGKWRLLCPGRNEDSGDGFCVVGILAEAGGIRNRLLHVCKMIFLYYKENIIMCKTEIINKNCKEIRRKGSIQRNESGSDRGGE